MKLPKQHLDRELPEASARAVHLRTRLRSHVPGRSRPADSALDSHSELLIDCQRPSVLARYSRLRCWQVRMKNDTQGEQSVTVIRAAITQTTWTGDKSRLDKRQQFARDAKAQSAGDLLPGAVLRSVLRHHRGRQVLHYAEPDDGPVVQRFAALAAELSMVMVLPIFEESSRRLLQHRRDGRCRWRLSEIPQEPHPEPRQVLGEVLLVPATQVSGVPDHPSARSGSTSATTGTFRKAGGSSA